MSPQRRLDTMRWNFIDVQWWISNGCIFIQIILQAIFFPSIKCLSSSRQRHMAFDQAVPHTWCNSTSVKYHLSILRCRRLWVVVFSSLLHRYDWRQSGINTNFWPQRRREELVLTFRTYSAVIHHLIISHLLVCWRERERISEVI